MQRIPNPGSDLGIFVRIFQELHQLLLDRADFDLDDMTMAMVERNNVSSQGAFGEEALQRSTRKDRSRDPLYNQSKMYAELYRTLGWFQSTTSSLRFAFSFLGEHVAATKGPKALVVECLLGIAYPNDVLGVQGSQSVRIFSSILRAMDALGGTLSRDEMIVGPLSIDDDRSARSFARMVALVKDCRNGAIDSVLNRMEQELNITYVTMGNYTRFPIAAVQWAGWATKEGNRGPLRLTEQGRAKVAELNRMTDVRLADYKGFAAPAKSAFIRYATYRMLERAEFDVSTVIEQMGRDRDVLRQHDCLPSGDVLFSPFQQIARGEVNAAFPDLSYPAVDGTATSKRSLLDDFGVGKKPTASARVTFRLSGDVVIADDETEALAREVTSIFHQCRRNEDETADEFARRHVNANQDTFYALVGALFRVVGFDCRTSRRGVNYARADAMIVDPDGSIPIEIKSPGEETEISVKAIRQALENKVVLLSRRGYPADAETTSLVVGFNPPNERSEVHELVEDIFATFAVRIGVLDFRSLVKLAVVALSTGHKISLQEFRPLKGVIRVERFTSAN